ncbi:MAG: inner membrane protein YiaA [Rhodoferax sp.]
MSSVTPISAAPTSGAYTAATYVCLGLGALGFLVGLWNAEMQLNEKGYYFTLLAFGLFAAVSLQKCVRDREEQIPVSGAYLGLCYAAVGLALLLLAVGLWNATLLLSEKGYYAMSFVLALYSAVTVQKNIRDNRLARGNGPAAEDAVLA